MAVRNNNTFIKKQKAEKRLKKRADKQNKMNSRKENPSGGGFESMIAYVDKFGNITSEPPVEIIESPEGTEETENKEN